MDWQWPQKLQEGAARASVTVIFSDPNTKLAVCIADGTEVSVKRKGVGQIVPYGVKISFHIIRYSYRLNLICFCSTDNEYRL